MRTRLGSINQKLPLIPLCAWMEGDPQRIASLVHKRRERFPDTIILPREAREDLAREVLRESGALRDDAPDLLDVLPPDSPDRRWVSEVQRTVEALAARRTWVAVDQCEWNDGPDGGWLAITGVNVSEAEDFYPGDLLRAGFLALRRGDGLEVTPRLHRVLCANGSVMYERDEPAVRHDATTVAAAVENCLSKEVLEREIRRLTSAERSGPFAVELAQEALRRRRDLVDFRREGARQCRSEEGPPRLWSLLNELTAAARGVFDLVERIERERDVARILARLRPPAPSFQAGLARSLDGLATREMTNVR